MRGKMIFKTPEEVEQIAQEYFNKFPKIDEAKTEAEKLKAQEYQSAGILPTMSSLCLKLGFYDLRQFDEYEKRPRFRAVFKAVRLRLLSYWESALATGKGTQGVTSWINYVTSGAFLGKIAETNGGRGSVAVVVIGADGSRQTLNDILSAQNTPQIQKVKTIDTTAQEVKGKAKKQDGRATENKRRALRKLAVQKVRK